MRELRQQRMVGGELVWVGHNTCTRQLKPARLPALDQGSSLDTWEGVGQASSCVWHCSEEVHKGVGGSSQVN